jgi:MoaA/NifB/PqqE/SkfB family radical SAM enzyme
MKNQDLFRASLRTIDPESVAHVLQWLRGEAEPLNPISIHLYLTSRCTARCTHCRQWTWPDRKDLSRDEIEQLFRVFRSWGVRTVTLGGGNPLHHPSICSALEMAHAYGLAIGIISEGITMNGELADAICQYAQWIRFSLDGPQPHIHDAIRNKPGLWDIVVDNVRSLKSRRAALRVGLNCLVHKTNIELLPDMIDLARRIGADILLFKIPHGADPMGHYLPSRAQWMEFVKWVHHAAHLGTAGLQTNLSQLRNMIDSVFQVEDVLQGKPVRTFYLQEETLCLAPMFFLTCDSTGNMFPCDYLQADTRHWGGRFEQMRRSFCLGNVFANSQTVLDTRSRMLQELVLKLPTQGYGECGCCTRFCQLNASLTHLHRQMADSPVDKQSLADVLCSEPGNQETAEFF